MPSPHIINYIAEQVFPQLLSVINKGVACELVEMGLTANA